MYLIWAWDVTSGVRWSTSSTQVHGVRTYDQALGVWHGVEPLADQFAEFSPYSYASGDPVNRVDRTGKNWEAWSEDRTGFMGGPQAYARSRGFTEWYNVWGEPGSGGDAGGGGGGGGPTSVTYDWNTGTYRDERGREISWEQAYRYMQTSGTFSASYTGQAAQDAFRLTIGPVGFDLNHPPDQYYDGDRYLGITTVGSGTRYDFVGDRNYTYGGFYSGWTDDGKALVTDFYADRLMGAFSSKERLEQLKSGDLAPIYRNPFGDVGYFTLPCIGIFGNNMSTATLQHEYGHVLQADRSGYLAYYTLTVPVSFVSAFSDAYLGINDHNTTWTETQANTLSYLYFGGSKWGWSDHYPIDRKFLSRITTK